MSGDLADPQLVEYLRDLAQPAGALDVDFMRASGADRASKRAPGPEMAAVTDVSAGGVPARLYRPTTEDGLPLAVYLHGGGWTIGSIQTHDRAVRRMAKASGLPMLSLDYRLAPEHPWPASIDDTVAALRWVASGPSDLGGRPPAVAIVGDSAGGTLATLASLRLRDAGDDALPAAQMLLYPNTDLTGSQPSMREKATGYGLEATGVRFFNAQWVPDAARWNDPGVSPLHVTDLSGMPATVVITAEHDPLRDEGEAYARRLQHAGVAVTARREAGLVHGFMTLDEISPACAAAADRAAGDLAQALGRAAADR